MPISDILPIISASLDFNDGDKGNVIYIPLLPLANVLLSIIIVPFVRNVISGKDIVDHSDTCHNYKVAKGKFTFD